MREGEEENTIHKMDCDGSVNSSCEEKKCQVLCSDGGKVSLNCFEMFIIMQTFQIELECEKETVEVNADTDDDGASHVECKCGDGRPKFRSCFPFC